MKNKDNNKVHWFRHDIAASNDLKLIQLQLEHGFEGLGYWWRIVELLYQCENKIIRTLYKAYSYGIRSVESVFSEKIEYFVQLELLHVAIDESGTEYLYSKTIAAEFAEYDERAARRSEIARENVKKRWEKEKRAKKHTKKIQSEYQDDTNGIPPVYNSNTAVIPKHTTDSTTTIPKGIVDKSGSSSGISGSNPEEKKGKMEKPKEGQTDQQPPLVTTTERESLDRLFVGVGVVHLLADFISQIEKNGRMDADGKRIKNLNSYAQRFIDNRTAQPTTPTATAGQAASRGESPSNSPEFETADELRTRLLSKHGKPTATAEKPRGA